MSGRSFSLRAISFVGKTLLILGIAYVGLFVAACVAATYLAIAAMVLPFVFLAGIALIFWVSVDMILEIAGN